MMRESMMRLVVVKLRKATLQSNYKNSQLLSKYFLLLATGPSSLLCTLAMVHTAEQFEPSALVGYGHLQLDNHGNAYGSLPLRHAFSAPNFVL